MRRFLWFLCLLPIWAACSCDGKDGISDAKGVLVALEQPLDFGKVFIGSPLEKEVLLKNEGRTVVHAWVDSIPVGYHLKYTKDNPLVIAPSATVPVKVVFSPDREGRFDGELILGTSGTRAPADAIKIQGEGIRREILTEDELSFGVVPVLEKKTLPLVIRSDAGADLTLKLSLGERETNFSIGAVEELTLPAGGEVSVDVTFQPLAEGGVAGRLSISTCPTCEPNVVRLRGEGGRTDLRADPPMLTFGTISPGKKQELALRLVNAGNMPIEVARAAFVDPTDPAFVGETVLDSFPTLVEVDQVHTIQVAFAPAIDLAVLGEKEGSLAFFGPSDELLFDVPLRGIAGGPDLKVDPGHIDFGVVPLRVQSRKTVTLSNIGNRAPANVEEIFVRGNASRFEFRSPKGLSFALEDEPVVIEVFFTAPSDKELVGPYADTLVIRTDDDDSREIQVALTANAADIPPCDLRINPGQVRFGLVPVGVPFDRDVEVFNQGIADCAVWDFHLENGGAGAFSLVTPPEGTKILASRETLTLKLHFAPPAGVVNQLLTSAIVFSHSTPDDEPKRVEVSGYPSTHQLEIIPNPIDFGPVPIGYGPIRAVSIINTGATGTEVANVTVDPPSGTNFRVSPGSASTGTATVPGVIGAGERAPVRAAFTATTEGVETAELQVWIAGVDEPLRVPMRAEARDEPCGDLCEAPQAVCPPSERVLVNHAHPLPGEAFNAAGDNVTCTWRIVNKPYGSRELPSPADACATSFTPDMVGDYLLEMAVLDEQGKYNSCQTTVTAIPHGGLWVEMFWENASDVDLHLLHPTLEADVSSSWWSDWDCYYGGRTRGWDGGGDASASLDRDDTQQTGPENIRINRPVIGHRYSVGVHWYRNAGHTSTWVTTNIYCGGVMIGTDTFTMNSNKEFVLVGDIQNNGIAGCMWRPNGTRWIRN